MIRALIADDEKLARERLAGFLQHMDDVSVVGEACDGLETVRLIEETAPDLVFLDVQMPGLDGFGVLRSLASTPRVIFATAFDEYAIKAFEVEAVDYLLKPFSRARITEAVRRVRADLSARAPAPEFRELLERLSARERRFLQQVPVHRGKQILILPAPDILWFEVEFRLVYAHVDSDRYMTNFTLKQLEERLDPELFFRAHKSRLVNLQKIRAVSPWFGGRYKLVMADRQGSQVELSRTQARILRGRLNW